MARPKEDLRETYEGAHGRRDTAGYTSHERRIVTGSARETGNRARRALLTKLRHRGAVAPEEAEMGRGLIAALVALLLAPAPTLADPQAPGASHWKPVGFRSCVAGTYLGDVALVEMSSAFRSLSTFGADGNYVTESTIDFGASGTPMVFRSAGRGHWWMIGPRQLKMTYLHFAYDRDGVLLWQEKISAVQTLSSDCSSATGEATYGIYPPQQDPFGDEPPAWGAGHATVAMRRMPRD
jgi:hypothetical protein